MQYDVSSAEQWHLQICVIGLVSEVNVLCQKQNYISVEVPVSEHQHEEILPKQIGIFPIQHKTEKYDDKYHINKQYKKTAVRCLYEIEFFGNAFLFPKQTYEIHQGTYQLLKPKQVNDIKNRNLPLNNTQKRNDEHC